MINCVRKVNMKKRNRTQTARIYSILVIISYLVIVSVFWLILRDQLKYQKSEYSINHANSTNIVGEIGEGVVIQQDFYMKTDVLREFTLKFHTYGRVNQSEIRVNLIDTTTNQTVYSKNVDTSKLVNDATVRFSLEKPLENVINHKFQIMILNSGMKTGLSPSVWFDSTSNIETQQLKINGSNVEGGLTLTIDQSTIVPFDRNYFVFTGTLAAILLFVLVKYIKDITNGNRNTLDISIQLINRYKFLLTQLIGRDFKTKYRRSVLGVLWSFLNPLLTMIVQYVVFSNIFRSSIENFPVYLLSAIIVFNFFSEASNLALTSVTSNASLITKVYIPKYVFPISRVLSSSINFGLSFIPLTLVVLLTGQRLTFNIFLLSYSVFFTVLLFIGIGFILSTLLVFFRDMQFLWSVILLIWMYATPIFYPASIIPARFQFILTLNPIYHIISFNRTILLYGSSPDLNSYLIIAFSAIATFLVGAYFFKKSQDKFIFYL